MTLEELFEKEFGGDKIVFEEDNNKKCLTIDGEEIKNQDPIDFEKELEEIKELLLDTEVQMKGIEEMLEDIDSQLKSLDKNMIEFENNVLPRLAGFKMH